MCNVHKKTSVMVSCQLIAIIATILFLTEVNGGEYNPMEGEEEAVSGHYKYASEWLSWKTTHSKNYDSNLEDLERHIIWLGNKKYIDQHNANSHVFGFTLAMNHLGDLTDREYSQNYYCYSEMSKDQLSKAKLFKIPSHLNSSSYPDSLDWRTKGAVGSIKDQYVGQCSSCYAFSAIGALEGANALAKGYFVSLSEQNILDCSVPYGNYGCSGGNMYNSFMYVVANEGVDTESSYPYKGRQSNCYYNSNYKGASMSGIIRVKSGDESSLLSALYSVGPIAVAVDGRSNAFKYYYSGVFASSGCSTTYLTHSMLLTGYGTYNGKGYWLVKNSWGENWGNGGYILMTRNGYNQCGIASDASYPTL